MGILLTIIRWVLGVFFALSVLVYLTTSLFTAIGSLILAVMLIPPLSSYIFTKIPYRFPRKGIIAFGIVLLFVVLFSVPNSQVKGVSTKVSPAPTLRILPINTPKPTEKLTSTVTPTFIPTATSTVYVYPTTDSGLSNDTYYTNSDGNQVHSPAYSNTVPAGATAQCRDGSYSFSQHHSGTCSGHGGVAKWL